MPTVGNIDHKIIVGVALGVTTTVALASTIKLCLMKRRRKRENRYETQKLLNEYLLFHYGSADEILLYGDFGPKDSLNFHKKCADLCIKHFEKKVNARWRSWLRWWRSVRAQRRLGGNCGGSRR